MITKQERKEFSEMMGNCCERCGLSFVSEPRLRQIHHRNGDRSNNSFDNLELLCFWCHFENHNEKDSMMFWALNKNII